METKTLYLDKIEVGKPKKYKEYLYINYRLWTKFTLLKNLMYFLKISTFSDYNGNIDSLYKM